MSNLDLDLSRIYAVMESMTRESTMFVELVDADAIVIRRQGDEWYVSFSDYDPEETMTVSDIRNIVQERAAADAIVRVKVTTELYRNGLEILSLVPLDDRVPVTTRRGNQTVDGWVEAQMRTLRGIADGSVATSVATFVGVPDDPRVPSDTRGWTSISLHDGVPRTTDELLRGQNVILAWDLHSESIGYVIRDRVRELYSANELTYVVPLVAVGDRANPGRRLVWIPTSDPGTADAFPLPCEIGDAQFRRDPDTPPVPIWYWRTLSGLAAQVRAGREGDLFRNENLCLYALDTTLVSESRFLANTKAFGDGAGAHMLRYYGCEPCTLGAVARARATLMRCLTSCPRYHDIVRENLILAEAAGVSCRSDPDPVTLVEHSPKSYRQAGNVALVLPPRRDGPQARMDQAACFDRGDLLRSMRNTVAADENENVYYALPLTADEWVPEEHGVVFADAQSSRLLSESAERVFALVPTGFRTLSGLPRPWTNNPYEPGSMHVRVRRTFSIVSLSRLLQPRAENK